MISLDPNVFAKRFNQRLYQPKVLRSFQIDRTILELLYRSRVGSIL